MGLQDTHYRFASTPPEGLAGNAPAGTAEQLCDLEALLEVLRARDEAEDKMQAAKAVRNFKREIIFINTRYL